MLSGNIAYRTHRAAQLYQESAAPVIILTQGYGARSWNWINSARSALVNQQVPAGSIFVAAGDATSTFDESEQVLKFLQSSEIKSVLIVTDPYHTLRAKVLFSQSLTAEGYNVRAAKAGDHWYNPWTWMFRKEGWRVTFTEVVKLAALLFGVKGG